MESEYRKLKDELVKLKYLIKKLPFNKKKLMLIRDYVKLCSFLSDLGVLNYDSSIKEIWEDYLWYKKACNRQYDSYIDEYFINFDLITDITDELVNIYQQYPIVIFDKEENYYVKHEEMIEAIEDFLGNFDNEMYRLFQNLFENKHILLKKHYDCDGATYNISSLGYPYIILKDCNANYNVYSALIHEIGHGYEYLINKTNKSLFDFYALAEVPAIFLQKVFDNYLIKNNCYQNAALNETLVWRQGIVLRNFVNSFTNKAYLNGQIIEISSSNDEVLIDNDFYKNIDANIKSSLEYYKPNLENYLYVISDVIANSLIGVYEQDPKEGLKLFKRFVRNVYYHSYRENILQYLGDFSYDKKELQIACEFQKQKYHL